MKHLSGKNIVITGASSGIGEDLAIELSKYHNNIIITGRKTEILKKNEEKCKKNGSNCFSVIMDLENSESIENAANFISEKFNKIDLLINNAGISQRSLVRETEMSTFRKIMEINFFGTIFFTKLLLKKLLDGDGRIAVVSSISGKFGFPLRSGYGASKHALHGFFEALYLEEYKNGLKLTMILPGRVKTNISFNAITADGNRYGKLDKGQAEGISSQLCAKKIIKAIDKEKKEVLIGGKEILMVYIKRFFPELFFKIAKKIKPT